MIEPDDIRNVMRVLLALALATGVVVGFIIATILWLTV